MIKLSAAVVVTSKFLSLHELEVHLGTRSSERGYDMGTSGGVANGGVRPWSAWIYPLTWNEAIHPGTAGIDGAISLCSVDLAQRLAELQLRGCDVGLSICQWQTPGDPWTMGIHLARPTLEWLAVARAEIDIDQYIELEE